MLRKYEALISILVSSFLWILIYPDVLLRKGKEFSKIIDLGMTAFPELVFILILLDVTFIISHLNNKKRSLID